MCEFCKKFDFATATTGINGNFAHIYLATCNTRFPKAKQFNFCPVCGRDMRKEDEGK